MLPGFQVINVVSSKTVEEEGETCKTGSETVWEATLELQAYLFNDLSVMLIIVCGGKVGREEAPAISTQINKITIAPIRDNVLYMLKLTTA